MAISWLGLSGAVSFGVGSIDSGCGMTTIVVGGVLYLGHKKNRNYDETRTTRRKI